MYFTQVGDATHVFYTTVLGNEKSLQIGFASKLYLKHPLIFL